MANFVSSVTTGNNMKSRPAGGSNNNAPRRSISGIAGISWMTKVVKGPCHYVRRCKNGDLFGTPLFVPAEQPIELFFFQRIFDNLCERLPCPQERSTTGVQDAISNVPVLGDSRDTAPQRSSSSVDSPSVMENREVPLVQFHRAMVRLFRILKQPIPESQLQKVGCGIDANKNGKVGWYEFCSFWKENHISVRLTLAERIFLTLEDSERSLAGRLMSIVVFVAILVSTGCFILSTVPEYQSKCPLQGELDFDKSCKPETSDFFKEVDLYCVVFFSIEYGLRLLLSGLMRCELVDRNRNTLLEWMVTENTIREPSSCKRVSNFFFNPANLIDLAAIMPWFLSAAFENSGGGDNFVIRLIRLTRVIRAIRLGSRFESVIIIVRSIRRSIRALYVLVLNLTLGVIIFGSLMYFCEGGEWDKEKRAHVRPIGQRFNETTRTWAVVYDKSPFESIPACFWWAVVTATTVGYGDYVPTTPAGKVVAGISMAWSLCVLALPIGVIGNNFSQVWEQYDEEKREEENNSIKEEMMLKRSIAWGDPLHYSRRVLLEVWHDPGMDSADDQAEFMGEVDLDLELDPKEPVCRRQTLALTSNFDKARRRVRGAITFEYTWKPAAEKSSADTLLTGALEILVLEGEDLISVDWKGSCFSDPYCVVVAYPQSPHVDGLVQPHIERTQTMEDTSNPRWNYRIALDVHWTQTGTANCMAADMKQIGMNVESSPIASAPSRRLSQSASKLAEDISSSGSKTQPNPEEVLSKMVPELQEELHYLQKLVVPQIRVEIHDVRQDLQLILQTLRKRSNHSLSQQPPAARNGSAFHAASSFAVESASSVPLPCTPWSPMEEPENTGSARFPDSFAGDNSVS